MDSYALDSVSSVDDSCESADEIESADENENDILETCCYKNRVVQLPECFCTEEEVVLEVLSANVWKNVFNSKHRERLKKLLPVFPEEDEKEKNITLRKLVQGENFKFGVPFQDFFRKLKDGFLSCDIAEVTKALTQANHREYKNQQKNYTYQLFQNILLSRKKLIDASYSLPPDQAFKMQQFVTKPKDATLSERTRLRYFSALQDFREEVGECETSSEDENYPESNPPKVSRKLKKQLQSHEASLSSELARITSTTSFPPELSGCGPFFNHCFDMFEISDERYREMLETHKARIILSPDHPTLKTSRIDLKGVISRCNLNKRNTNKTSDTVAKKKAKTSEAPEKFDRYMAAIPESKEIEKMISFANVVVKEEPKSEVFESGLDVVCPNVQEMEVQTEPLTIVEEDDSRIVDAPKTKLPPPPQQLPEVHPTCFFALLRDIFCESAEQKLSAAKLEERVKNWQGGPTASLFEWLSFQESWSDLVSSALKFLAGDLINILPNTFVPFLDYKEKRQQWIGSSIVVLPDGSFRGFLPFKQRCGAVIYVLAELRRNCSVFCVPDILPDTFVPFLDYKEKQQQWQWIGSGRDSDEQMFGLCQQWLDNKDDISSDILEASQGSPPPPRMTTIWTVRPTTEEEKIIYHQQECVRYQNPHKAFTFKVHGYEAVVGPVKGVYGKESGVNKAREHSLLTSDRPPFVTILSLVRDSAARLPNGEGTRADICELLKDSQYLSPASEQQIHTVVSGALDRLHYEKDPCVKYDVNRKLWIYLHRHRTEEEFERIHQAQAAAAKARKAIQKTKIPKIKNKEVLRTFTPSHLISNPENVTLLNVDIPSVISTAQNSQSPRGGNSPRTQGARINYALHTLQGQKEVKCSVLGLENQMKNNPEIKTEPLDQSPSTTTHMIDNVQQTLSSIASTVTNSRQSQFPSSLTFPYTKGLLGATQIVNVTPIQIKTCPDKSRTTDLNVDMKPSSPSFVGQPPVLQPILSVDKTTPMEQSLKWNTEKTTSSKISMAPTVVSPGAKTKVTCANLPNLQGFQTIVIKQEPGMRTSTIPLLSIEERLPQGSQSPVVARLLHGSQYLSFSNIVASSAAGSAAKPTVQNFRVQGGNLCQQVLSTSTIKVVHSTPVSAISDSRLPVLALKNQLGSAKDSPVIAQAPTSLNVCGRLYQMANIRNPVIPKDTETKTTEGTSPKESSDAKETKVSEAAFPVTTIYNAPVVIANRNPQTVVKVSQSGS